MASPSSGPSCTRTGTGGRIDEPGGPREPPDLRPSLSPAEPGAGSRGYRRPQAQPLAGLVGQVIDAGVGTGASFPHYPPAVGLVLAIEPEPHTAADRGRRRPHGARSRQGGRWRGRHAARGRRQLRRRSGVLCAVHGPRPGCSAAGDPPGTQARRAAVLPRTRPGRLARHHADPAPPRRHGLAVPHAGGCHLGRDTSTTIGQAGFIIERLDRFMYPEARTPLSFQIIGQASRGCLGPRSGEAGAAGTSQRPGRAVGCRWGER